MFDDAVIRPKHKETTECFFVEEIAHEMSPKTNKSSQLTYKSFFEIKYGQSITQDDQPLLRISNANEHHFMFAPVSTDPGSHKVKNSTWTIVARAFEIFDRTPISLDVRFEPLT